MNITTKEKIENLKPIKRYNIFFDIVFNKIPKGKKNIKCIMKCNAEVYEYPENVDKTKKYCRIIHSFSINGEPFINDYSAINENDIFDYISDEFVAFLDNNRISYDEFNDEELNSANDHIYKILQDFYKKHNITI